MDFTKDIYINKDKICEDSEIVILYKGFLFSNNLTDEVYLSYGYGNLWENKNEIKMKPSTFGYLATIQIGSGKELQFCFKNSTGEWDNNNNKNYILPIEEAETVVGFEPVNETSKEITFELVTPNNSPISENEQEQLLEPSVVTSNTVELYQTIDLENITKQAIPNNTIITQIKLDENNQNVVSNAVVKTPETETVPESFAKITEKAKEHSVTAFDEDKVTAGSVYVNSLIQPTPKIVENIEDKYLVPQSDNSLNGNYSFIANIFRTIKLAFAKVVKLVKTSFNFGEDEN